MNELLHFAFEPVNIFYSILLLVVLLYWLSVFIGALDIGVLDFDLDIDADVDADTDIDVEGGGGWFVQALQFFNFGLLPFMVIFSFLVLFMWMFSILGNYYLSNGTIWFPLILFLPALFFSLLITKVITYPMVGFFKQLKAGDAKSIDFTGRICELNLPLQQGYISAGDVMIDGSRITLSLKPEAEVTTIIPSTTKVLITRSNEDNSIHFVRPLEADEL
ncbi:MAG: hypothetical protein AAGI49_17105 [Bacteroidota bacterium]